ncbi:MAG TPA: Yip1 family protein [Allosphingosinicella sp.]|nr:Yip1 family protein [Allosphingosinicella sp.]
MEETPNTSAPKVDPAHATAPTVTGSKGLVDRARDILMKPKQEWAVIDREPATIGGLYTGYVMILAAIPAVAFLIGMLLFVPRISIPGLSFGISTGSIIAGAVVQYLLALASVYIMALIIDGLAPTFNSQKNQIQAFKVAAYYPTAAWLAGIVLVLPQLAILALVGSIYSLYLLYQGLPVLMKTPEDKKVPYFVATLVLAIIVFIVIGQIANRIVYGGMF